MLRGRSAGIQDRDGAKLVLSQLYERFPSLVLIWADGGYAGQLVEWVAALTGWVLQIVKRTDDMQGFVVRNALGLRSGLPKRWIVERTLAWLGKYRRLSKDYELLPESSVAFVHLAMIHIMVRRLSPGPAKQQAGGWASFRRRAPVSSNGKASAKGKKAAARTRARPAALPASEPTRSLVSACHAAYRGIPREVALF